MTTKALRFGSRLVRQSSLTLLGLFVVAGAASCTRPTLGFCTIDENCDFGQFCSLPAHECTTATVIRAVFSGGQVVPPTASGASGTFMMVVNADSTMGTYTLNHNVPNVTAIDMFQGKVGTAGIPTNKLSLNSSDTMPLDPDLVRAMKVGNYSLLISSAALPSGEVRAQMFSSNPLDTAEKISFDGVLSGLQQSPPNTSPGTGTVHMELDEPTQSISYSYSMGGIQGTINGIHIHAGGFNVNGPHICDLQAVTDPMVQGVLTEQQILGFVNDPMYYLAQKHLWRIILKSGDAYLNIHSDQFVKGELRAQLLRTRAVPFGVVLNPVAGGTPTSSGIASFYLNSDQTMLAYNLSTDKVPGITGVALTRGSGGPELTCPSLTGSGGADKSQGYCPVLASSGTATDITAADLMTNALFLRVKTGSTPTSDVEGQLVIPR
jgi:hypothetical protein